MGCGKTESGKAARGHRSPQARPVDRFIHRLAHILVMALLAGTCMTILGGLFLDVSALIPVDENGARQAMFESVNAHRLVQSNSGGDRTMKYSEIFVGRTDTYARASNGGYQRVGKPLTPNVLLLHRLGHISVGIYLIRPEDSSAKVIVLDMDEDDPEAIERLAEQVVKYVPKKAVIIEKTGGRGWHIWVLFNEWVPAGVLKRFGEWLVKKADASVKVEVFPKQAKIMKGGFGNLVRLPLGKHPRTGERGKLLDADMRAIESKPTEDGDLDLVGVEPCGPHHIPHEVASDRPLTQQLSLPTPGTTFPEPLPCFHEMTKGVKEGCRDKVGFALAKHLRRQGKTKEEAQALLLDWNPRNRPPLPRSQVLQKVDQAYDFNYRSLDCEKDCIKEFCQPGCPILNKKDPAEVAEMLADRARRADGEERRRLALGAIQYIAKLPHHDVMTFRDIFREDFGILKKDFEQLVREAKSDVEKREKRKRAAPPPGKGRVLRHLFEDEPHALRQSLDYHNGVVYTLVQVMDEVVVPSEQGEEEVPLKWERNSYVVTSQREMFRFTDDELRQRGLYIDEAEEIFTGSKWSKPSIRRFLEEGYEVDPATVFSKVRENLAFYMEFDAVQGPGFEMPPSATVDLVAHLIMASWFVPVFDAIPYVFNHGEMATGKSKLARVQAKMSFLGEWVTPGTTTAAMKRLAAQGASLFFDNIENIQSRDFDPDQKAIILASNTRGARVALVEEVGNRRVVRRLNVFGLKGFNNIGGLPDVLASRVIRIPLVRGTDSTIMNRDPDGTPPNPWEEVVDDLYVLAMTTMGVVNKAYDEVSKEGFEGREWQKWRPVFALAHVIDDCDPALGLEQEMEDLATAKRYEETQAGEVEDAYWILLALVKKVLLEGRTGPIPNHEVLEKAEELNPDLVVRNALGTPRHLISPTALGQIIKRLRVTRGSRRKVERRTAWVYDPRKLKARAGSYGIDIPPLQRPLPSPDTPEGSEE